MPPKKRTVKQHTTATQSLGVPRRLTRSTTPVYKDDDWQDKPAPAKKAEPALDDIKFLVNRLSRVKLEEVLLDALKDPNLTKERLEKKIVDGLPGSLRDMKMKKTEVITWRGVDRAGMGGMGKAPGELIVEILNYLSFRERLKMVIFVAKGFLGLMHEKSLWRDVENSPQIDGFTLEGMISPAVFGQPLLPMGCIRELGIDLEYCSSERLIQILRRLHSKGHPVTSLNIKGTRKKMAPALAALLKQAQGPRTSILVNISQITKFTINSDYNNHPALDVLRKLFEFMPNLTHLDVSHDGISSVFTRIEYRHHTLVTTTVLMDLSRSGELLRAGASQVSHNYLKSLCLPSWSVSLSALEQLGSFFPELERLSIGTIGPREEEESPVVVMPRLRSFEVSGYSAAIGEDDISRYFISFLVRAPEIRELTFRNIHAPATKCNLFKAAKCLQGNAAALDVLGSPELEYVDLEGWCVDPTCIVGERRVWVCPKLVRGTLKGCVWEKEVDLLQLGVWRWVAADPE